MSKSRMPAQTGGGPTKPPRTTSDTGTDTAKAAAPTPKAGAYGNGAMQDFLSSHRETLDKGRDRKLMTLAGDYDVHIGVDTGVLDGFDPLVAAVFPASVRAAGEAVRASGYQRENDPSAWQGVLWGIADELGESLDPASSGQISYQWRLIAEHFPEVAADPRYTELGGQIAAVESTGRATTRLLAALLQPFQIYGKSIGGIQGPRLSPEIPVTEAIATIEKQFFGLLETAFAAEGAGNEAKATGGRDLESTALDLAVGPIGAFPVGSPEFEYVWAAFEHSSATPQVKARLSVLLGVQPSSYLLPVVEAMAATNAWWGTGSGGGKGADGAKGGDEAAADAAGPDALHGEMEKRAASAPGTGFASDDVEHPEFKGMAPDEDEEDEKAEEKEEKPEVGPAKYGASGGVGFEDGKATAKLSGTRTKNPDGTGSDASVALEGGVTADRAYGTLGADYTSRTKDEDGKSGMDVAVGGKAGTNADGKFVAEGSLGATVKGKDGGETKFGSTVGWNGDGVEVGKSGSKTTELYNGDKQTTSGGASFNQGTGEATFTAGRSTADADGNVKSSTSASGTVDVVPGDGKSGVSGAVSHTKGKVNVAVHGSWKQELKEPVAEGKRWRVDYTESYAAGGSLGGKGKKVGGSAGVSFDRSHTGTRYFDSKAEAEKFWKEGAAPDAPESVADARSMKEGETHSTSTGKRADLAGNAQVGMFSIGGGVNFGNEDFANTKRGADGKLRVEVGSHVFGGWNASAGAGGVSLGYGESSTTSQSRSVEFDLDTAPGRWAYQYYLDNDRLPPSGRGWREVGTMKGQADTRVKSLGLLGLAAGVSHTVSHTEREEDGHRVEEDLGVEGLSASIPLLGSHSEKHGLYMRQVDEGNAFYQTETVVKSSDVDGIRNAINRGTDQYLGTAGSNKGTYKVQSVFSQKEIDGFLSKVEEGGHGGGTLHSNVGSLRASLRMAPDDDARRRLLAKWVADNGSDALQLMFDYTRGDKNANFYVEIEGDPYLKGMAGHLEQENRISKWQGRIDQGEGGFGIANEVAADIAYQRKRRDALRKYGELPQSLLEREYERTDQHLVNLQLLQDRALATVQEMAPDTDVGITTGQYQRAQHVLRRSRAQYAEAHRRVQQSRRIHHDGFGRGLGLDDSAREEWTSERGRYTQADKLYKEGQARELSAQNWESMLAMMELGPESAGPMATHTARAAFEFQAAARAFDKANAVYHEITDRRGPSNLTRGYQFSYTDGM